MSFVPARLCQEWDKKTVTGRYRVILRRSNRSPLRLRCFMVAILSSMCELSLPYWPQLTAVGGAEEPSRRRTWQVELRTGASEA
jgi:hypothetical protein